MKLLIIFLTLFSISYSEMEKQTHYNVSNFFLNILEISETEIIMYGSDGAILKSTDAGENWHQYYSGTHSYIKKLIYSNNIIYGINNDNQLMISLDKGDYWEYIQLNFEVQDLTMFEDNLIIADEDNKIYVSNDNGKNWNEKVTNLSNNLNIIYNNNILYLVDINYNLYSSKDFGEKWDEIEVPLTFSTGFYINNFNDNIFISNNFNISKLTENNDFNNFNSNGLLINDYYVDGDNYYLINADDDNDLISLFMYDNQTGILDTITIDSTQLMHREKFNLVDFKLSGNNFICTLTGKTALKLENNKKEWKQMFYLPFSFNFNEKMMLDNGELFILDNHKGKILKSTNYGKTFNSIKFTNIDSTSQIDEFYIGFSDVFIKNKDTIVLFSAEKLLSSFKPTINYTTNGGESFDTVPNFYLQKDLKVLYESNEFLYFYFLTRHESLTRNELQIWKLSLNNFNIEHVNTIDSAFGLVAKTIINEKRIFAIQRFEDYQSQTLYVELFSTENNFETIDIIKKFENNRRPVFYNLNKFQSILKLNTKDYYLIDEEITNIVKIQDTTINTIYRFPEIQLKDLDDFIFTQCTGKIIDMFNFETDCRYVKLIFQNNSFIVDTLGKAISGINILMGHYFTYNDYSFFINPSSHFYIPIEPERLEYYASSVESGGPPAIWTYPPYPNPVKDKMKMKFYSAMMSEIAKLQVELIEIGSGRSYKIYNYQIMKTSDYWGEIIIDVGKYQTGAYLINFKLGNSNKSESIIIE